MAIRKRIWKNENGTTTIKWLVTIGSGKKRQSAQFDLKKEAEDYFASTKVDIRKGVHVAPSKSPTVREAGKSWIEACKANNLEFVTVNDYQSLLGLHIFPFIGEYKLSALTIAIVRKFQDDLRTGKPAPVPHSSPKAPKGPRSADMVKRCTAALGALLADAQERGTVAQNVVRALKANRRRGKERQAERRAKGKLVVGVDIPTPQEIDLILGAAGDDLALFLVLIRTGLRASELRGLRWADIDLDRAELHVRQRADRHGTIGPPKSEAGDRSIPIPRTTLAALREWKLKCPKGPLGLVFPNGAGNPENRNNIVNRKWRPLQVRAGISVSTGKRDRDGKPIMAAKYAGLHALRHHFASWCINARSAGGLELTAKAAQERLGHSSIALTLDTYGHLFPRGDDHDALAAAEGKHG